MDILKSYYLSYDMTKDDITNIENDLKIYNNQSYNSNFNSEFTNVMIEYGIIQKILPSKFFGAKIYIAPNDYLYQMFKNEIKQNLMINELINKKQLFGKYYLRMIGYNDNQSNPNRIGYIIYPNLAPLYLFSLSDKHHRINLILTQLIILYQTTGLIHGDFTIENMYLSEDENGPYPIIGGFGQMRKGTCLDHIKEFIWFVLQVANQLNKKSKSISHIGPEYILNLMGKNYFEVDKIVNMITQTQIDEIYEYWIFNK